LAPSAIPCISDAVTAASGPLDATIASTTNGVLLLELELLLELLPEVVAELLVELLELHAASPRLATATAQTAITVGCLIVIILLGLVVRTGSCWSSFTR
jgi:hypothetical protein